MTIQDYKIDGDYICIHKKELEEFAEHYHNEAMKKGRGKIGWFYLGKREVLIDMLKHFEMLEG
jgi:intein-encoded DNA endonuclease-like protein